MNAALGEVELTAEEVERILKVCGPHALLVGGQALAAWVVYYGIEPAGVLSRIVTMDADFIGTRDIAQRLQGSLGYPWKLRQGTLDDVGPQIAKVYATLPEEGIKQVDFLSSIVGLDTEAIRRRASELTLADGTVIHLLQPLDVLESRLRNLHALASKRNPVGIAQARLAVKVARAFIEEHISEAGEPSAVRQALKRIERLALDTQLSKVSFTYNIDVLSAIPIEKIAHTKFRQAQWPRILARLEVKRQKFVALEARRELQRSSKGA
jgi:hypothetical protein